MPPICPIDTGVELVQFTDDVNTGQNTFWECPRHGGRYVSHGIVGLIPVPKALTSNPPIGFQQVYNMYVNPTTQEFIIIYGSPRQTSTVDTDLAIIRLQNE